MIQRFWCQNGYNRQLDHGQMEGKKNWRPLCLAFYECELEFWVITTIVESGLDVTNAKHHFY